jgi:hypothetical protein
MASRYLLPSVSHSHAPSPFAKDTGKRLYVAMRALTICWAPKKTNGAEIAPENGKLYWVLLKNSIFGIDLPEPAHR